MENHPIPQDVTGFKFRLIGSVTVKQFLYLLGGGVFALLFYFFPIPFLLKLPFMFLSGGVGLCLAFVPIDGRPMDKMLVNFFKAIPAENQYIYKKHGAQMPYFTFTPRSHATITSSASEDSAAVQKAKLFNQLASSYFKPDPDEKSQVENVSNLFKDGTAQQGGFTNRVIKADENAPVIPASASFTHHQPEAKIEGMSTPHAKAPALPVQENKSQIVTPPAGLSQVISPVVPPTTPIQSATPPPAMPPQASVGGIDMANILQGKILDPRGKPLPHIIVEVLDTQNVPLRTFRTDANGFFRAATPLPNGMYTLHLEDTLKKQDFQDKRITLDGSVAQPIQVISVDQREKLRRELFGVAQNTP
jgi:hypothetical protein